MTLFCSTPQVFHYYPLGFFFFGRGVSNVSVILFLESKLYNAFMSDSNQRGNLCLNDEGE